MHRLNCFPHYYLILEWMYVNKLLFFIKYCLWLFVVLCFLYIACCSSVTDLFFVTDLFICFCDT
uniref:Uncharacterized protein n=1 Tax=Arundo donax TaxID=35708 RepID=A0A0A9FIG2_ARUDO